MKENLKPGDTFESSIGFGLVISPDKVIIVNPAPWGYTIKSEHPPPDYICREGHLIADPIRLAFDCVCEVLGLPCT